jgi:methyl-accepting chemotaxis protein
LTKEYVDDTLGKTDEESMTAQPLALDVWNSAMQIRLTQYKFTDRKNDLYWDMLQEQLKQIGDKLSILEKATTVQYNLDRIMKAREATSAYTRAADEWVKNDQDLQVLLNQMNDLGTKIQASAVEIEDTGWTAAEDSHIIANQTISRSILINIAAVGGALLLALLLSLIVSRSITVPLSVLTGALQNIQRGELNRDMTGKQRALLTDRKDEIGIAG